jgi:uncharacterized Zn-binding protein involved in type VI secretion
MKLVRLGDEISCGSVVAEGSNNVFANGMPVTTSDTFITTGHGPWPPSQLIGPYSSTVFVNGFPVALADKTKMVAHAYYDRWHNGVVSSGSPDVNVE